MSGEAWTILIIDGGAENRDEIRRLLLQGSDRRYRFAAAETGAAGIDLCRETGGGIPDCLVVGFHLPDMDALELLAELRLERGEPPCPVVVITGPEGYASAREVLRAGAHTFIGKGWMTPDSVTRGVELAVERFAQLRQLRSTQRALEQERTLLRIILENLPTGVMVTDTTGRPLLMNSALNDIWRGSRSLESKEQYQSYRAWTLAGEPLGVEDWPISRVLSTGKPQGPVELRIERFDGSAGVTVSLAVPVWSLEGDLMGAAAVAQDVTEQRRAQERLAQQASVLDNMVEAVNVAARNGVILYTNPSFSRTFGYAEGELVGQHVSLLNAYSPEENERKVREIIEATESQGFWRGEVHNRRRDGSLFFTQATVSTVAVGDEKWFISVQEDITERKLAEEERSLLHARERQLREQAEAASRAKDEFVAIVSHELRTPLNAIAGWTQILRQRVASDEMALRAVETIERNAKTQTQLIEDLLDMSRVLSGKLRLEVQRVDPAVAVANAVSVLRHAAEARGVALDLRVEPGLPELDADPARLQQILWNLISNAVKFTATGGRVEVLVEPAQASIRFTVSDTGKGISPDFLPHVFDRFRQAEGALTRRHGGLGLGLSIVRHLAELHGGTVAVASEGEGRGAVFTVELPARSARRETPGWPSARREPAAAVEPAPIDLSGARVLVVDDDRDTRDAFAHLLLQSRAEVVAVGSGREALTLLRRGERFDCFVCDIGMPETDGLTAIAEVRALDGAPSLPALAVTAFAAESDRAKALAAGFDAFLAKPVSPERLLNDVAALIVGGRPVGAAR